jgi:protein TonB
MHFSHLNSQGGTKVTKIAVVAAFHVILAMLLIKSMNSRTIKMPTIPAEVVLLFDHEPPPPPPKPPEPMPMPDMAPPLVVAPPPEIEVRQTPPPDAVRAEITTEVPPQRPAVPRQAEAPPAQSSANTGVMRTAVLANACATPDYPARAARDGQSGTVTLALLVGADGRVADSRVQSSSGSKELDRAAIAALSLCKFKPASNNGVAEQGWAQISYVWMLDQ